MNLKFILKQTWIRTLIIMITAANLLFSLMMTFKTTELFFNKCTCITRNVHWIFIFFYLIYGVLYLTFLLLQLMKFIHPSRVMIYFSSLFAVLTILFIIASFEFTKYIQTTNCNCLDKEYQKLLAILTNIREFAVVIGILAVIGWFLYVITMKYILR